MERSSLKLRTAWVILCLCLHGSGIRYRRLHLRRRRCPWNRSFFGFQKKIPLMETSFWNDSWKNDGTLRNFWRKQRSLRRLRLYELKTFELLDVQTSEWSPMPDMTNSKDEHCFVPMKSKLFVIGYGTQSCEIFDSFCRLLVALKCQQT